MKAANTHIMIPGWKQLWLRDRQQKMQATPASQFDVSRNSRVFAPLLRGKSPQPVPTAMVGERERGRVSPNARILEKMDGPFFGDLILAAGLNTELVLLAGLNGPQAVQADEFPGTLPPEYAVSVVSAKTKEFIDRRNIPTPNDAGSNGTQSPMTFVPVPEPLGEISNQTGTQMRSERVKESRQHSTDTSLVTQANFVSAPILPNRSKSSPATEPAATTSGQPTKDFSVLAPVRPTNWQEAGTGSEERLTGIVLSTGRTTGMSIIGSSATTKDKLPLDMPTGLPGDENKVPLHRSSGKETIWAAKPAGMDSAAGISLAATKGFISLGNAPEKRIAGQTSETATPSSGEMFSNTSLPAQSAPVVPGMAIIGDKDLATHVVQVESANLMSPPEPTRKAEARQQIDASSRTSTHKVKNLPRMGLLDKEMDRDAGPDRQTIGTRIEAVCKNDRIRFPVNGSSSHGQETFEQPGFSVSALAQTHAGPAGAAAPLGKTNPVLPFAASGKGSAANDLGSKRSTHSVPAADSSELSASSGRETPAAKGGRASVTLSPITGVSDLKGATVLGDKKIVVEDFILRQIQSGQKAPVSFRTSPMPTKADEKSGQSSAPSQNQQSNPKADFKHLRSVSTESSPRSIAVEEKVRSSPLTSGQPEPVMEDHAAEFKLAAPGSLVKDSVNVSDLYKVTANKDGKIVVEDFLSRRLQSHKYTPASFTTSWMPAKADGKPDRLRELTLNLPGDSGADFRIRKPATVESPVVEKYAAKDEASSAHSVNRKSAPSTQEPPRANLKSTAESGLAMRSVAPNAEMLTGNGVEPKLAAAMNKEPLQERFAHQFTKWSHRVEKSRVTAGEIAARRPLEYSSTNKEVNQQSKLIKSASDGKDGPVNVSVVDNQDDLRVGVLDAPYPAEGRFADRPVMPRLAPVTLTTLGAWISAHAKQLLQSEDNLVIRAESEELGILRIHLMHRGHGADVSIRVQSEESKNLLENSLDDLKQQLEKGETPVTELRVFVDDRAHRQFLAQHNLLGKRWRDIRKKRQDENVATLSGSQSSRSRPILERSWSSYEVVG